MNDLGYIHLRIFLKVIPKGHLSGKVAVHQCCAGDTWYIMLEDEEMKKRLSKLFICHNLFIHKQWLQFQ